MSAIEATTRGYAPEGGRPLRGYTKIMAGYGLVMGAVAGIARLTGRRLPERIAAGDVALVGVATHKLSRLVAKDAITSPLRTPFTRYVEPAGEAELNERPRGHGLRHSLGELVSCPFCLDVWIASGLLAGLVMAPRITRLVASGATAVAAADFLHLAYDAGKNVADRD